MRIQPKVIVSLATLALALPFAPTARADSDAFVGGLVGGMLGSAISNAAQQQQQRRTVVIREQPQTRTVVRRAPAVNTYERQQNAEVQTALNYFGFPAGAPDGVLGRNSRSAISQYQAFISAPPSGYLTDYDRSFLTSAYNRALIGGPQVQQQMASYAQGPRGLLLAFRAEQQGIPAPVAPFAPRRFSQRFRLRPRPQRPPSPSRSRRRSNPSPLRWRRRHPPHSCRASSSRPPTPRWRAAATGSASSPPPTAAS